MISRARHLVACALVVAATSCAPTSGHSTSDDVTLANLSAPEPSELVYTTTNDAALAQWASPNRRLTRFEIAYAIEDVFGVDASVMHSLPAPHASIGNRPDILVGSLLDVSETFLAPYRDAARVIARDVGRRFATECEAADDALRCESKRLRDAARRLWRRPVTASEVATLLSGAARDPSSAGDATSPNGALANAIYEVLSSEQFYVARNERDDEYSVGDADAARARRIATRMALVLWSSVPDDALIAWSATPDASNEEGVRTQVERMTNDPRFRRFTRELGRQWLGLDRPATFRTSVLGKQNVLDEGLAERARDEVAQGLFAALDEPVATLLDPPCETCEADAFDLLTSLAVLTAVSSEIDIGGHESWLGRGLVIQSAMLCRTWPLAAVYPVESWNRHPLLDPLSPARRPNEKFLLEDRTSSAPCQNCHEQLETLGAALATFDGKGEAYLPDVLDVVTRAPRDVESSRQWLRATGRFEPCVATKLSSYVLQRSIAPTLRAADRRLVDDLVASPRGDAETAPAAGLGTLREWLTRLIVTDVLQEPSRDAHDDVKVVRERPNPLPDVVGYRSQVALPAITDAHCATFDAQRMLHDSCGDVACHGPGGLGGAFVGADEATTRRMLSEYEPNPTGPCASHESLLPTADGEGRGLLIDKITATDLCGAPMPIAGGPRTLNATDVACLEQWLRAD